MSLLLGYLDVVSDFFGHPAAATRALRERAPAGLGALGFFLSGWALVVAQALAGGGSRLLFHFVPWQLVLAAAGLLPVVTGFILAGVFHLTAEFLGARHGSAAATFVLLGLCELVYCLYLPIVLASQAFFAQPAPWRWAAMAVLFLASLGLKIAGLSANYEVDPGRAFAVLVLPYLAALVAGLAFLAATVGSFLSLVRIF